MEKFNWLYLLYAIVLISTAQIAVWFQHNWQFINEKYKPEWWGWYIVAIPITYLFLKGTYYGVTAFDGDLWPNRFIGFILGIISYAWLTNYFFKQPVTGKILVQLILCFLIVLVQVMWKEKTQQYIYTYGTYTCTQFVLEKIFNIWISLFNIYVDG